jgi:hypothetical protein
MCARLRAIVAAVVLLNLVSALNDIAEADVAHVAQLDEAPQPKVPAPQIKVAPRRKAIRINGDMYIGHDMYIGNRMRLKRKEHMLDWNKGLHSKTLVDNLGYNADFTNFVNGHVSLAHSNGMMIDSQSKAKSGPNARFRNQGMTEVQLASQSGRAIHATSPQGGDWTGFFSNKATTVVKLAGPDGTGLHCETKTGKASAIFVNAKSRVDISTIGGQAIQSSTTGASATWNAQFEANLANLFLVSKYFLLHASMPTMTVQAMLAARSKHTHQRSGSPVLSEGRQPAAFAAGRSPNLK